MAKNVIRCLFGVIIAGILGGLIVKDLKLGRNDCHPDVFYEPEAWVFRCALVAWLVLVSWLIADVAYCRLRAVPPPPHRGWLLGGVWGWLGVAMLIGMFLPCVSYRTPDRFVGTCGDFMREQMIAWQSELPTDRYPAATMAELYAAWLQNPPTDWSGKKRSMESWRSYMEECQTLSSYRHRSDFERLPNEEELAYCYCGGGVSFSDKDAIIFYEKPGLHAKAGDIRHVVYADGRVEKVPPSDWPRIAARIERQQAHKVY